MTATTTLQQASLSSGTSGTPKANHAHQLFEYAYREVGDGPLPLVLLQHFPGNLDNWDAG
jgi:hypothetical protein